MKRSWILVGMMGAGKSSLGRDLAKLSGRDFVDTDRLIEHRFNRPVSRIFDFFGEPTFRGHETSILKSLEPGDQVVATGGGIVMLEDNWAEMKRLGITVFLNTSVDHMIARIANGRPNRPLLQYEDWRDRFMKIYESRLELYQKADIIFVPDTSAPHHGAEPLREQLEAHP